VLLQVIAVQYFATCGIPPFHLASAVRQVFQGNSGAFHSQRHSLCANRGEGVSGILNPCQRLTLSDQANTAYRRQFCTHWNGPTNTRPKRLETGSMPGYILDEFHQRVNTEYNPGMDVRIPPPGESGASPSGKRGGPDGIV